MKLKINNEYIDVEFWSFLKCNFLTSLMITFLAYAITTIIVMVIYG